MIDRINYRLDDQVSEVVKDIIDGTVEIFERMNEKEIMFHVMGSADDIESFIDKMHELADKAYVDCYIEQMTDDLNGTINVYFSLKNPDPFIDYNLEETMERKKIIENVYVVGSFNKNRIQTYFINDSKTEIENLKENGKVIEEVPETYTLTIKAESREMFNQLNEILSNPLARRMFSIKKNEDEE